MRALSRPAPWFALTAIWLVVLFWLSHQSHLHPPGPEFANKDKVLHTGYFTLGGFLFFIGLWLRRPGFSLLALSLLTIAFCSGVGVLDEFHQSFIPNRSGNDPFDWMADTLGGILGSWAGRIIIRRFAKD